MGTKTRSTTQAPPDLHDPVIRQRFEESLRRWEKKGKPVTEAVRSSERLSPKDLAIRINTRD